MDGRRKLSYPIPTFVAMENGVALAERLAGLPVGVELMTLVESLDPTALGGAEVVALLAAEHRLAARFQARVLRSMVEVARHIGPEHAFLAPSEIASAIGCTDRQAEGRLELATDLAGRLPRVFDAMLAGRLDERKGKLFSDKTRPVQDDGLARRIADEVLSDVDGLSSGQIGGRLSYRVSKYDPDAAARRARRSRAQRRIEYADVGDGTAVITGVGLPVEQAAAAVERVDAFALAARRGGDPRTLQQLRADVLLGLLAGTWPGPDPVHRVGVVELTVPLTTLMGLQKLPGELAGWGPLCADLARQTSEQILRQSNPQPGVRFTVHDDDGTVVANGTTTRRPPKAMGATVRAQVNQCVFPRCRKPASHCDLDHRERWADGGPTTADNLHPLCRRHHRAKDEGGWQYTVTAPGVYQWTSPLGQIIVEDRRRFIKKAA